MKAANAKANGTAETATATGAKTSVTEAVPRKGKQNGGTVSDGESKTKPPAKAKASSDDDDDDGGRLVEEKFGIASWNFFCHALLM